MALEQGLSPEGGYQGGKRGQRLTPPRRPPEHPPKASRTPFGLPTRLNTDKQCGIAREKVW